MTAPGIDRLDVEADLDVTVDGEPGRIEADGDVVVVDLPASALRGGAPPGLDAGPLREVARRFADAGLTLDVRADGRPVAEVGAAADGGRLARATGTPVRLRPGAVAVAPRPRTRTVVLLGLTGLGWFGLRTLRRWLRTTEGRRRLARLAARLTLRVTDD